MQLIYAVGMYDRLEYVYVGNLNRRWKESLFTANWGYCGVTLRCERAGKTPLEALATLSAACDQVPVNPLSTFVSSPSNPPQPTSFGPVGAHKHAWRASTSDIDQRPHRGTH